MYKSDAEAAVKQALDDHFPEQAVRAIREDEDMWGAVVRRAADDCGDMAEVDEVLAEIARDVDASTSRWLEEEADSPAGWLYSKMRG